MKKRIWIPILIFLMIVVIWGGVSLFWLHRQSQQYDGFIEAIVSAADVTGYDKEHYKIIGYDYCDSEGYAYGIKQPGYLSMTGNLSVMAPVEESGEPDALIIWVEGCFKTEYSYGVLLYDDDWCYQVLIDKQGNAIDPEDKKMVEEHRERIDSLLKKASQMWKNLLLYNTRFDTKECLKDSPHEYVEEED